jgi:hypothetical protein
MRWIQGGQAGRGAWRGQARCGIVLTRGLAVDLDVEEHLVRDLRPLLNILGGRAGGDGQQQGRDEEEASHGGQKQ